MIRFYKGKAKVRLISEIAKNKNVIIQFLENFQDKKRSFKENEKVVTSIRLCYKNPKDYNKYFKNLINFRS